MIEAKKTSWLASNPKFISLYEQTKADLAKKSVELMNIMIIKSQCDGIKIIEQELAKDKS